MRNLTLKIACLAVAILVWIQVAATTMVEANVSLPLNVVGLGEGLTVAGSDLPAERRARLRLSKLWLLAHQYFGWELGSVQVNLSGFAAGPPQVYVLKDTDVRTDAEVVTLVPPVRLDLRVDRQVSRALPVRIPLRGQVPADRMLIGPVTAAPESVLVSGPARYFARLVELTTETLELNDLDAGEVREVALVAPPAPLELARTTVRAELSVVSVDERIIANVPVLARADAERPVAGISPPVCDIMVRGPADSVAGLSPAALQVTVPVLGLDPGVHRVTGEVVHPDWVIAIRLDPESFMVIVDGGGNDQ